VPIDWYASFGDLADWRQPECYEHLREADRRMFAWEWLRRCPEYRRAWLRHRNDADGKIASRVARRFGLAVFEDPASDAFVARPVWRSEHDPHVVLADAQSAQTSNAELFDILQVAPMAHVAIGNEGDEHWLLSNGYWLLRLDIVEGTLLGGPVLLRFRLEGLASLLPRLQTLGSLVRLLAAPESRFRARATQRTLRWISELRTADALERGASHREIARGLFGEVAQAGWRLDSDAYRSRVRRLVRAARCRLNSPLSRDWFDA